ncbi:MAG: MBL fold metallo-hydrolase [Nocardioidaceae bacterium]
MSTLTWLGQFGFAIDVDGQRTLLDPWLTDHVDRTRRPLDARVYATGVHTILVSHEHEDHFDRDFVRLAAETSPDLRLVLPREIAQEARELIGPEQVLPAAPGEVHELGVLRVEPVRADHMMTGTKPEPGCLGYVVQLPGGPSIYHSGDCIVTDAVLAGLEGKHVDIALLPINGRDYFREGRDLVGNMTAREAVEFAQWMGAQFLVPSHWDADTGNTERPGTVPDYAWEIDSPVHTLVMACGRPLPLDGLGSR